MSDRALTEIKKSQTGTGLLIENDGYISLDIEGNRSLRESVGENGGRNLPRPFIVSAVFQKYGVENANGRIYPEATLKREVERYQTLIAERRAYGECNHPETATVDLERVAMNIVELHWEGRTLVGKMEIPITEGFREQGVISCLADQVAHLILSGLKIGVSSRALGSVRQQGGVLMVDDDLELICWDVVSNPSTPGSYVDVDQHNLEKYFESEKKSGNIVDGDKYSKFDKWLLK